MSLLFLGLVPQAFAQDCYPGVGGINLGNCLKLANDRTVSSVYREPAFLVNLIVRNLFVVAGIILFLLLILAGFKFITGGQKGAEDAKGIVQTALIGFIIMFAAYWIMQIIALLTGTNIPGVS